MSEQEGKISIKSFAQKVKEVLMKKSNDINISIEQPKVCKALLYRVKKEF